MLQTFMIMVMERAGLIFFLFPFRNPKNSVGRTSLPIRLIPWQTSLFCMLCSMRGGKLPCYCSFLFWRVRDATRRFIRNTALWRYWFFANACNLFPDILIRLRMRGLFGIRVIPIRPDESLGLFPAQKRDSVIDYSIDLDSEKNNHYILIGLDGFFDSFMVFLSRPTEEGAFTGHHLTRVFLFGFFGECNQSLRCCFFLNFIIKTPDFEQQNIFRGAARHDTNQHAR